MISLKSFAEGVVSEKQRVATNSLWLGCDRIARALIGLALGSLIVRQLGPEKFGILIYAMSFAAFFYPLADLGLTQIVVRELVRRPGDSNRILGSALALKIAGGIAAVFTPLIASLVFNAERQMHGLILMAAAACVFQAFDVIDYWYQSRVESKKVVLARGAAHIVIVVATLICLHLRAGVSAYAALFMAGYALNAVGLLAAYRISGGQLRQWKFCPDYTKALIVSCIPLVGSGLLKMTYSRLDRILLGRVGGKAELGVYAVAATIFEGIIFIPAILVSSVFPAVVAARERGGEFLEKRLRQYFALMATVGYAVAIAFTLFAVPVVRLLFGAEYVRAGAMLVAMGWAFLFVCIGAARNSWLMAENRTVAYFITTAAGALTSVALNMALIPKFKGMGAAFAQLAAHAVMGYLTSFLHRPQIKLAMMMTSALMFPARCVALVRSAIKGEE